MTSSRERRLLNAFSNIDQLNKQRASVGASAVTSPKAAPTPQTATRPPDPVQTAAPAPYQDPNYNTYLDSSGQKQQGALGAGNPVYSNEQDLRSALEAGVINQEQYNASVNSLRRGGLGVDPLGFGPVPQDAGTNAQDEPFTGGRAPGSGIPQPKQQQQQPQQAAQPVIKDAQKPLTGADLRANAEKRRKQRLKDYGIDEGAYAEVKAILDRGGRIAGTENNRAYFLMPDGSKVFSPLHEDSANQKALQIAGTDFEKEIQDEQSAQAAALRAQNARRNMANQQNQQQQMQGGAGQEKATATSTAIPEIDATIASLMALSQNSTGISQEVFAAYLPTILGRLSLVKDLRRQAETMDTPEEQAAIVEKDPGVTSAVSLAAMREKQFNARLDNEKRILAENQAIALEANRLATESLELDKKIIQERQRADETRKLAENMEGEKHLRRSLNAAGVESSPAAIEYLQSKINQAADQLDSMRQTNNLTILKFDVARKELANDTRAILNDTDAKRSSLYANYDENIFNLDQFVSGAKSTAFKDLKAKLDKIMEKEDVLFQEAGDKIAEAGLKAAEFQESAERMAYQEKMANKRMEFQENMANKRQAFQEEQADKRMRFQEGQANVRMGMQINNQNRQQMNADKRMEMSSSDDVRSLKDKAYGSEYVVDYLKLRTASNKLNTLLNNALATDDPNVLGGAKQLAMTLVAKSSDPTTGVRESELEKFGKNQSWIQKVMNVNNAIFGGDTTGLSLDSIKAYKEMIELETQDQKVLANAQFAPVVSALITHNNRSQYFPLNPTDVLPVEFLEDAEAAFSAYTSAQARIGEGYNFQWDGASQNPPEANSTKGLGDDDLLGILKKAGFEGKALNEAYAIARAESGGRTTAYNGNANTGDKSYGLFQINMLGELGPDRLKRFGLNSNEDLFDPMTNAKIAFQMSGGGKNWSPWSAYKNGSYRKYLSTS